MKKNILILSVLALAFTSCKKNENADVLVEENTTSVQNGTAQPSGEAVAPAQSPEIMSQETLLQETKNKPQTSLALSENHWDFKDVKKGESVEHVYEVTNTGENPLIISQVKPGCGCTAPDYTKEPIMPGQKGRITLKFDSSNFEGLQNKQAEVYANVEKAPIVLTFAANVVK